MGIKQQQRRRRRRRARWQRSRQHMKLRLAQDIRNRGGRESEWNNAREKDMHSVWEHKVSKVNKAQWGKSGLYAAKKIHFERDEKKNL